MTDETARDLGLRAVACKGWRKDRVRAWHEVGGYSDDDTMGRRDDDGFLWRPCPEGGQQWWPDLRDPCTLGGLLALVREAWGEPVVLVPGLGCWGAGYWFPGGVQSIGIGVSCTTEAEALVAALEAAP